ncbi:exopolygalacturonase clone GBGE184 [Beta vulgaris subsp. vulgaris]|uniref:exopolygalacturonase clone GBGE184 n=1 Tax=Beta vulgaris subsp. vulgaris TaxID=3555 RepID=UPI0020375FD4|nr:exopolygalacturonase clone GBGE184 [Beta vulgaris subsp. vulgaris]
MKAWQKACHCSQGPSKVVIPNGEFVVAEVIFAGRCKSQVTVELQGNIVADPDVSQFPNHEFIVFEDVDGVTLTGHGTIDVSNQANKSCNPHNKDANFFNLMPTVKVYKAKNIVVEGIKSVNPSTSHVMVLESQNVIIRNVKFDAKSLEPNTNSNGIYISASNQISVSNSYIRSGADCVTVAPGSTSVSITGLTCEAGLGISIGAQAFSAALDVKGVIVKNCTIKGSVFGARIIPRVEAKVSLITGITFQDLIMEGVQNPIFINQQQDVLKPTQTILAKIVDVHFKNIKGTVTTRNALTFSCSPISPCEGIEVVDIDLNFIGTALLGNDTIVDLSIIDKTLHGKGIGFLVNCLNAKVLFGGKHEGLSCGLLQ